ncbi:MAG: methylenetetrahydrofolate reductase [Candidatus Dormibacteria bacterium]
MRILDRISGNRPCFSFEFFPPHTEKGVDSLFRTILELKALQPGFVSCTYPGSAGVHPDPEVSRRRALTLELTRRIRRDSGIEAMAHLTCSGHTSAELAAVLDELVREGAENVLALRGDPPSLVRDGGSVHFEARAGGFSHGEDLVRLIRERGYPFSVGVACYPETHMEAASPDADLDVLKRKMDAGADFAISQLFFDNHRWFDFVERARAAGITIPLVPGLMPITSRDGIVRMTSLSGASLPAPLRAELDAHADDEDAVQRIGVEWGAAQASELMAAGFTAIHFCTLNRSRAARDIVSRLGKSATDPSSAGSP